MESRNFKQLRADGAKGPGGPGFEIRNGAVCNYPTLISHVNCQRGTAAGQVPANTSQLLEEWKKWRKKLMGDIFFLVISIWSCVPVRNVLSSVENYMGFARSELIWNVFFFFGASVKSLFIAKSFQNRDRTCWSKRLLIYVNLHFVHVKKSEIVCEKNLYEIQTRLNDSIFVFE